MQKTVIEEQFFKYYGEVNGWNHYIVYTEWFPADVKPVNVGWYITNAPDTDTDIESQFLWWWDGIQWTSKLDDDDDNIQPCFSQNRKWRGLCATIKK